MNGIYYVFPNILREEITNLGYTFRKITSEFARRGYIIPEKDKKGKLISTSVQKTYRGINTRFYAFKLLEKKKYTEEESKKIKEQAVKVFQHNLEEQKKKFEKISSYSDAKVEGIETEEHEDIESVEIINADLEKEKSRK